MVVARSLRLNAKNRSSVVTPAQLGLIGRVVGHLVTRKAIEVKLGQGDTIKNEHGERKVLGVCGEVYFLPNKYNLNCHTYTLEELKRDGYTKVEPKWKPTTSKEYWSINLYGIDIVYRDKWDDVPIDVRLHERGLVFKTKTKAEAEAVAKKMLESIQ